MAGRGVRKLAVVCCFCLLLFLAFMPRAVEMDTPPPPPPVTLSPTPTRAVPTKTPVLRRPRVYWLFLVSNGHDWKQKRPAE